MSGRKLPLITLLFEFVQAGMYLIKSVQIEYNPSMKIMTCLGLGFLLSIAVLCGAGEAVVTEILYIQDLDGIRNINNLDKDYMLMRDLDFNDDESYDQTDIDWETKKTAWTTGVG